MHWVIQNNIYAEEGYQQLLDALSRLGVSHSVHKVLPFLGVIDPEPEFDRLDVIVMGSYSLARHAVKRGWKPGAFLDNLDFEVQREHWGEHMLNHDARICRFEDVGEFIEPVFLRPVHDTKSFTGMVFDYPYYKGWRDGIIRMGPEKHGMEHDPGGTLTLDTPTMVCRKKEIWTETRCWVVKGDVVTYSGYKLGSRKVYSPPEQVNYAITGFARARALDWSPNDAYVMDIAETPDGMKIVEVNNLNSAGWYRADLQKLVMALENM